MLTDKMLDAINEQLIAEIYSGYLYLSMAAYFYSIDLPGFAGWMRAQRLEELTHAFKLFDYMVDQRGRVTLKPIEGPPTEWDSPLAAFDAALAHENKVTGLINALVEVAVTEGDEKTRDFLGWFVKEQVEEEESAGSAVRKIKEAAGSKDSMAELDAAMGNRGK